MEKQGNYRNDIDDLTPLKIGDYERIFKVYTVNSEDKEFYYYNILNKIDLTDLDDQYVENFEVVTRMPMTTISYKIYNDIKSWWIIYLMNKEKFKTPPFWVDGGTQLKFLKPEFRVLLYNDITKNTILGGRHY